jgi:hypothetical protein
MNIPQELAVKLVAANSKKRFLEAIEKYFDKCAVEESKPVVGTPIFP